MIDFELSPAVAAARAFYRDYAREEMRPLTREMDELEHTRPWPFLERAWQMSGSGRVPGPPADERNLFTVVVIEEMAWGDAGLYLLRPGSGLGTAAVAATGSREQKERLLGGFRDGTPKWAAMAITEPGCGSDTSALQTTAVRDGDDWVLNGTKVFCTNGALALEHPGGFVVVWATVDKSAGRAGIKPFVVEAGTPGISIAKLENKMGMRVSDTAELVLEDCRVSGSNLLGDAAVRSSGKGAFTGAMATFDATRPIVAAMSVGVARGALECLRDALEEAGMRVSDTAELVLEDCRVSSSNLLGDAAVRPSGKGAFTGAMATFDATRPIVAAMSVGVARGALECLRDALEEAGMRPPYGRAPGRLLAVERDLFDLETEVDVTRLLTWRAAWMLDRGERNSLEASIAKAKAGQMVTRVTQKVVEHLGPLGYSRRSLAEKWFRDAKINDIYEGTQQINLLIVARRILDYGSQDLN